MMDWTPPPPLACSLTPIHAPTPIFVNAMHGHRIDYVRVSSFDQNPERPVVVQALRDAGNVSDSLARTGGGDGIRP